MLESSRWPADRSAAVEDSTVGSVLRAAAERSPDDLRAYCREHLAPYKTPVHWTFIEAFPQTPSGKIQKFELRKQFLAKEPK